MYPSLSDYKLGHIKGAYFQTVGRFWHNLRIAMKGYQDHYRDKDHSYLGFRCRRGPHGG